TGVDRRTAPLAAVREERSVDGHLRRRGDADGARLAPASAGTPGHEVAVAKTAALPAGRARLERRGDREVGSRGRADGTTTAARAAVLCVAERGEDAVLARVSAGGDAA